MTPTTQHSTPVRLAAQLPPPETPPVLAARDALVPGARWEWIRGKRGESFVIIDTMPLTSADTGRPYLAVEIVQGADRFLQSAPLLCGEWDGFGAYAMPAPPCAGWWDDPELFPELTARFPELVARWRDIAVERGYRRAPVTGVTE